MNDVQPGPAPSYPVRVEVDYPASSDRVLAFCGILWFLKPLLLLPHLIVMWFLSIAAVVVAWIGFWIVLFTGSCPRALFDFVVGFQRWQTRMNAWMLGLVDRYPPFSLE